MKPNSPGWIHELRNKSGVKKIVILLALCFNLRNIVQLCKLYMSPILLL